MKGRDWYAILAPKMFGENQIAETPAIDPKSLIGRTVEVNMSELLGQPDKYYMSVKFKVHSIDGNKVYTHFHSYSCAREHLFRIVRKRAEKVRAVSDIETKDGWKMQIVSLAIMNRNTNAEIQKKIRKIMVSEIAEKAKKSDINSFIRSIASGALQKDIRKLGNKVYPVRFSEIESIEVKKVGEIDAVKTVAVEAEAGAGEIVEAEYEKEAADVVKVPEQ